MKSQIIFLLSALLILQSTQSPQKLCATELIDNGPNLNDQNLMNFQIKKKVTIDQQMMSERFTALNHDNDKNMVIKLYLRNQPDLKQLNIFEKYYWTYNDSPVEPVKECEQLKYMMDLVRAEGITDLQFEECTNPVETGSNGSRIPYVNSFNMPNGQTLSQYCIFGNCRTQLQYIAKTLLKGIKSIASGTQYYFEIANFDPDYIYFYSMEDEKYLTFTNVRYNAVPFKNKASAPWLRDMGKVGFLMAQLLSKKCDFVISSDSKKSPLDLFRQIHEQDGYDEKDGDVGVDQLIYTLKTEELDEKKKYLTSSIFDFIYKLLPGPNQFTDPEAALQHNFAAKQITVLIERSSDIAPI